MKACPLLLGPGMGKVCRAGREGDRVLKPVSLYWTMQIWNYGQSDWLFTHKLQQTKAAFHHVHRMRYLLLANVQTGHHSHTV